jgi:hypothetical protein
MQTTGIFTTHRFEIENAKYNEPIYVIPFGDVHRSAPLCHVEKWKEFLEWAKTKKRAYFLGCGDYDDLASTSEREMLGNPKMHESTVKTLESLYYSHTKRFAEEIKFMKGRCIGFLEGNHYGQFQNGTTTTQKLAEHLECKYLGVSSFIRLSFQPIERSGPLSIDIWAHHGQGASRLLGGSLNRVQQMAEAAEADIYLMGHDHKKSIASTTRLQLRHGRGGTRLSHRKMLLCRTGSFLKGYVEGQASYIADRAGSPTDLGVVKIELTRRRKCAGGEDHDYIDIHAGL